MISGNVVFLSLRSKVGISHEKIKILEWETAQGDISKKSSVLERFAYKMT
jgi:hypothetical protein